MTAIDVYQQYFAARCVQAGVERRGASVKLTAESDSGAVRYEASVAFFPHVDEEDFAVSYDACAARELYAAPGRRSRKREAAMLETLRSEADALAAEMDAEIFWDRPLTEARRG